MILRSRTILLAKRAPWRKAYPDCWSFPGGHVERRETFPTALLRECREEIGIEPTNYVQIGRVPDPNSAGEKRVTYHFYMVTAWVGGEPTIRDNEHTALAWFSIEEAIALPDLALREYLPLLDRVARDFSGS